MKTSLWVLIGVVVLILVVLLVSYSRKSQDEWQNNTMGYLYIGITDDTAAIQGVSKVNLEIEKIELRSAAGVWVTASSNNETYDLLDLKARSRIELHDKVSVPVGTYDEVRVTTGDVVIETATAGKVTAYKTTDIISFNSLVNVSASSTRPSTLTLDFVADQSLLATADKKQYVFTPKVNIESRTGAAVTVTNDNQLVIGEGTIDTNLSVGTDLSGTVRPNYVQSTTTIQINVASGTLQIMQGDKVYKDILRPSATVNLQTNAQLGY